MVKHKSEILKMSIYISKILDRLFSLLDNIFSFTKLVLHLGKSLIWVNNLGLELSLFISHLHLDLVAVLEFLGKFIFLSVKFLMSFFEILEFLGQSSHFEVEVLSSLQDFFFVFLFLLLQSYIKLFTISFGIVYQLYLFFLQVFVFFSVLFLYFIQSLLVLLEDSF